MPASNAPLLPTLIAAFAPEPPTRLGLAVSGGSDSLALLHLCADWARAGGPALSVATVDHGLRAEAAAEAAAVGRVCAGLGLPHAVLRWSPGWDRRGNLAAAAREARYRLLADWAAGQGIADLALGHTADDQAETVLMRLLRGSGADGLAAMAARTARGALTLHRPLLAVPRARLRDELTQRGVGWIDDPSNADPRADRIRVRQAMAALGLDRAGLLETALRMRAVAEVAEDAARALAQASAHLLPAGAVRLDPAALGRARLETAERLFAAALQWTAAAPYRPRHAALRRALAQALAARPATLHGCLILPRKGALWVVREPKAALQAAPVPPGALWDGRFTLAPGQPGTHVAALGVTGLLHFPNWRKTHDLPRAALLSSPALWSGDSLVAAPLLEPNPAVYAHRALNLPRQSLF